MPDTAHLHPLMAGLWDGANLWIQWTTAADATEATRYLVRVRMRSPGTEWGKWQVMGNPSAKCFRRVQTMREGWEIQAQVAVMPEGYIEAVNVAAVASKRRPRMIGPAEAPPAALNVSWEGATEVVFDRCQARFSFSLEAERRAVSLPAGFIVSAIVDGEPCSYRLSGGLDLAPGETAERPLDALHLSGWCQLDHPGHFTAQPLTGLTVTNMAPSVNDVIPTVADGDAAHAFTKLAPMGLPGGPLGVLVKTGRNWFKPTA